MLTQEKISVLNELVNECHQNSRDHGFYDVVDNIEVTLNDEGLINEFRVIFGISRLGLIGSETGEAVEGVRKPHESNHIEGLDNLTEELADIVIRVFDYAGFLNVDLGDAILSKMAFNRSRPYKHGKKA